MGVTACVYAPAMLLSAARRAGRRVKILVTAACVLLLLSTTYLTVTLRYELAAGNHGSSQGSFSDSFSGNVREVRYLAPPGGAIEYGFSIANKGPLTVRLEEIMKSDGVDFTIERVSMERDIVRKGVVHDAVPFQPVDLRPDEQVFLWVTLRFADEVPPRGSECSSVWFETQVVRFTVLGMPREQRVPLWTVIRLTKPDPDGRPCAVYQ